MHLSVDWTTGVPYLACLCVIDRHEGFIVTILFVAVLVAELSAVPRVVCKAKQVGSGKR
jgi:hypothetical protein